MSFFKDFKADFAQAVNELIPDSEEMTSEFDEEDTVKKKAKLFSAFSEDEEETAKEDDDFEIAPEDQLDDIDDMEASGMAQSADKSEPEQPVMDEAKLQMAPEPEVLKEPEVQEEPETAKPEAPAQTADEAPEASGISEDPVEQMSFDFLANAMGAIETQEEPKAPVAEESIQTPEEIDASYFSPEETAQTLKAEKEADMTETEDVMSQTADVAEENAEIPEEEKQVLDSADFSASDDDIYVDTFSQAEENAVQSEAMKEPEPDLTAAPEEEAEPEQQPEADEIPEPEADVILEPEAPADNVSSIAKRDSDKRDTFKEERAMLNVAEEKPIEDVSVSEEADSATTYITKGTKITGDIETDGSVDIIGTVEGNVICKGKLVLGGNIQGNVSAGEIYANAARIEGDLTCEGSTKIGVGSVVIGKVSGSSAVIAGAVNGDIDVQGPVIVDSTAVIMGNIKSRSVQINNGAVIEGFCSQCYSEIDVKSFFA